MYKVQTEDQTVLRNYKEKKFLFYKNALKYAKKFEGIIFDKNNHLQKSFISNKSIGFIPEKNDDRLSIPQINQYRVHLVGEYFRTQNEYCALRTLMEYLKEFISSYDRNIELLQSDISVELYGYRTHFLISFFTENFDVRRIFNKPLNTNLQLSEFIPNYIDVKNNCYKWYEHEAIDLYNRCFKDNSLYVYNVPIV
jgi:hypothetical protein